MSYVMLLLLSPSQAPAQCFWPRSQAPALQRQSAEPLPLRAPVDKAAVAAGAYAVRSGRVGAAAAPWTLALLHAAQDRLPAVLQIAEGQVLDLGREPEAGLHGVHVDPGLGGVDADLTHDALAVPLGEVQVDLGDLGEDVDVGRERGRGAVQEEQVLHEQHELLGDTGAVTEQLLGDVA